jgi:hypothetical protein
MVTTPDESRRVDNLDRAWIYALLIDESRPPEFWVGTSPRDGRAFVMRLITGVVDAPIEIVVYWADTPTRPIQIATFRQLDDARGFLQWAEYRWSSRRQADATRVAWLAP